MPLTRHEALCRVLGLARSALGIALRTGEAHAAHFPLQSVPELKLKEGTFRQLLRPWSPRRTVTLRLIPTCSFGLQEFGSVL